MLMCELVACYLGDKISNVCCVYRAAYLALVSMVTVHQVLALDTDCWGKR